MKWNKLPILINIACAIGLTLLSTLTYAETLYVGDSLRIGVRMDTTSDAASITVITTGATVELLQRRGNLARVRTEQGVEGWVKAAYLTPEKPAALLVREANNKIKQLEAELSAARMSARGTSSSDVVQITQLEQDKKQLENELDKLKKEIGQAGDRASLFETSSTWNSLYWLIGSLVVILSLGFLFGVTWHKHQVMKRLGGLRL